MTYYDIHTFMEAYRSTLEITKVQYLNLLDIHNIFNI